MIPAMLTGILLLATPAPFPQDEPKKDEAPKPAKVVDLTLKGTLDETPSPLGLDGSPIDKNLPGVIETIGKAREDDEVKALVLRFRDLAVGPGKANELRAAIDEFQEAGKPVVALLESAGNADYWVASAADRVVMPESGSLMLSGLAAEVTFYKGLFDKVGVQPDFLQVGEYKGAAEPYTRTEMSPEFREELTSVLDRRVRPARRGHRRGPQARQGEGPRARQRRAVHPAAGPRRRPDRRAGLSRRGRGTPERATQPGGGRTRREVRRARAGGLFRL